ncbi:MAG: hypothetical protein J7L38_00770 [Thermoproteales archaeon]|nr:hypothetical protein [Thermoproteales archaeon]
MVAVFLSLVSVLAVLALLLGDLLLSLRFLLAWIYLVARYMATRKRISEELTRKTFLAAFALTGVLFPT